MRFVVRQESESPTRSVLPIRYQSIDGQTSIDNQKKDGGDHNFHVLLDIIDRVVVIKICISGRIEGSEREKSQMVGGAVNELRARRVIRGHSL